MQRSGGHRGEPKWIAKPKTEPREPVIGDAESVETVTNKLSGFIIGENSGVQNGNKVSSQGSHAIWKPKSYGTVSGGGSVSEVETTPVGKVKVDGSSGLGADVNSVKKSSGSAGLSKLFSGNLLENFTVDNSTYAHARIRATFYPKFENEKSDQEVYIYDSFLFCFHDWMLYCWNLLYKYFKNLLELV